MAVRDVECYGASGAGPYTQIGVFTPVASNQRSRRSAMMKATLVAAVLMACVVVLTYDFGADGGAQGTRGSRAFTKLHFSLPSSYPDQVWVYGGSEDEPDASTTDRGSGAVAIINDIKKQHYDTAVHVVSGSSTGVLRDTLWNKQCNVVVFPPMDEYPMISARSKTDIQAFISRGGNMVFVGSYMLQMFLNDLFGLQLDGTYGKGPYFLNNRAAMNSPFMYLASEMHEVGTTPVVGVTSQSLPPTHGHCVYSNNGVCVAFYVEHGLGTICYIADSMLDLTDGSRESNPEASAWVKLMHAAIKM